MNGPCPPVRIPRWRAVIQWGFLAWVLFLGVRFGLFVNAVAAGGTPHVPRPPGVEGFLPIGALASLKYWLATGDINPVHPAALVIFLSAIAVSLLAKKSFCSWLCPVGTLSEGAWKLGRWLLGRNFTPWPWLDLTLRGLKYALLLFFVKLILLDMPVPALAGFLDSPYWAVSDVKMLRFFTDMSPTTAVILTLLTGLSLVYRNVWCRYLCPYGALLGLASILSPLKIRREPAGCTGCRRCSAACPANLPVHARTRIVSPECTACLSCVACCPERATLRIGPPFWRRELPGWVFPAAVLLLFAAGIGTGMATGHWRGGLTTGDYRQLLPLVPYLGH